LVLAACDRAAASAEWGALTVREGWARSADSGGTTAVYFVLANASGGSDTLSGVSSEDAATATMHVSMQQGRMMQMAPVTSLPVPAEDSVSFQPLGAHVMLTGLTRALVARDTVRVTLHFVSGRSIEVRADVRNP
jgi:copper(I)-binding protein